MPFCKICNEYLSPAYEYKKCPNCDNDILDDTDEIEEGDEDIDEECEETEYYGKVICANCGELEYDAYGTGECPNCGLDLYEREDD